LRLISYGFAFLALRFTLIVIDMSKDFKAILIIFSLGLIVYSYSLPNPFIWDDEILIVRNTYIRNWQNLNNIFTSPLFRLYRSHTFFYRPLQELTYVLDFQFWKLDPLGYHLTNTFFHIINAILIFFIINRITKDFDVSLLSSLLFVIHAIHTQAVTYISGRADLLVTFFLLLSFLSYIKYFHLLSILLFVPALFCKENALVYPLILILYDLTFRREKFSPIFWIKQYLPFVAVIALYLFLRAWLLEFSGYKIVEYSAYNLLPRIFSIGKVISVYLGLLAYPANLHMERSLALPGSFLDLSYLIPFAGLLFIIFMFFVAYNPLTRISRVLGERSKIVLFFLGWFFVFLLPMLNILKLDTLIAEHWIYLASVGIFVLVTLGLKNLIKTKALFYFAFVLILIFYGSFTIKRNIEWGDRVNFCRRTLEAAPNSFRSNYLLGQILLEERLYPQAIVQFKKTIALKPDESDAYNNLGIAYGHQKGEEEKAKIFFEKAIELNPRNAEALNNLGLFYLMDNHDELAYEFFKKTLSINPLHLGAMNNLGIYYDKIGKKDSAEKIWNQVISIDPLNQPAKYNLNKMKKEINQ